MSWSPEMRVALQSVLREYGRDQCPKCSRTLNEDDVEWRGTSTEAGTEGYAVEICCSNCFTVIAEGGGWGSIESTQDAIDAVDGLIS